MSKSSSKKSSKRNLRYSSFGSKSAYRLPAIYTSRRIAESYIRHPQDRVIRTETVYQRGKKVTKVAVRMAGGGIRIGMYELGEHKEERKKEPRALPGGHT